MNDQSLQNKKAWEHRAYEFWLKSEGTPKESAEQIIQNPKKKLKSHIKYFEDIHGLKIANPCGSNGRRAVALSLLGADVTVFDISDENKRYAMELAEHAGINLSYVLGDLFDVDLDSYGEYFDILYLEGGILHYFDDIQKLMDILIKMLKPGGRIVLNDFHPFRKVMPINFFKSSVEDYFESNLISGKVAYEDFLEEGDKAFPSCTLRLYTISEILNSMIKSGFNIKEFLEEPSWTDKKLPGEITILAQK